MKTITLALLFAIVPFLLFSDPATKDDKYTRGKIFLQNNDTINVYIKVASLSQMQSGIQYVDSIGKEHSLLPSKAKGFCLLNKNNTLYLESRRDLKTVLLPSKKSKSCFIYRVSNANIPLYYYIEEQLVMKGIDMIKVDSPRYMILFDQEWISLTPKYFVSDFRSLVSNLKGDLDSEKLNALLQKVIDGEYKFDDTPIVIESLNKIPAAKN